MKWKYPAAFACALLNSQPMGFYAPAQIVRDAREHGVEVRAVDVNHSDWDCTLEAGALRLGLRQIDGLQREAADALVAARAALSHASRICGSRGRVPVAAVAAARRGRCVPVDGARSARGLVGFAGASAAPDLPLFAACRRPRRGRGTEPATLPVMPLGEHVVNDYQTMRLSLKAHPMRFLREHYGARSLSPPTG